jgi:hypothetical protein
MILKFLTQKKGDNKASFKVRDEIHTVRFEVFTTETMTNDVFGDATPLGSFNNRRFGGTYKSHTA